MKYDCDGEKFFMGTDEKVSVHRAEDLRLIMVGLVYDCLLGGADGCCRWWWVVTGGGGGGS